MRVREGEREAFFCAAKLQTRSEPSLTIGEGALSSRSSRCLLQGEERRGGKWGLGSGSLSFLGFVACHNASIETSEFLLWRVHSINGTMI